MNGYPTTRRLGDLLGIQNGFAFDSNLFSTSTGTPLIRIRDLKGGLSTETRYSGDFDPKYLVRAGDLLIGMDGEFACYEWRGEPALLNQRVCRLEGFASALLPRYLLYGINKHLKDIEDVTGFATVKHLSSKSILNINMLVPPLDEQRRVITLLDESLAAIDGVRTNAALNLRHARLLSASHRNTLFAHGAEGWHSRRFGDVCDFVRGPFGGSLKRENFVDSGYAVYEQSHAIANQFTQIRYYIGEEKFQQMRRFEVFPNDIIMSCSGTIGRTAVVPVGVKVGIINQALLKLSPSEEVLPLYVKYWMESADFQDALGARSGGAAIQNVASVKVLKEIRVPVPPIVEQQRIVSILQQVETATLRLEDVIRHKVASTDTFKQSLLRQAFAAAI